MLFLGLDLEGEGTVFLLNVGNRVLSDAAFFTAERSPQYWLTFRTRVIPKAVRV
jgi:hypothetical protein